MSACNEYDNAIQSFGKALTIEPDNAELQRLLAAAKLDAAKWHEANKLVSERTSGFLRTNAPRN